MADAEAVRPEDNLAVRTFRGRRNGQDLGGVERLSFVVCWVRGAREVQY